MLFKELKKLWSEKRFENCYCPCFSFFLLILLIVSSIVPFYINLKIENILWIFLTNFLVLGRDEDLDNTFRTDVIILAA